MMRKKIPQYREKTPKIVQHSKRNQENEVVKKEFKALESQLESSDRKRRKWKRRCAETAAQLQRTKEALGREREDAERQQLMLRIQTHLDDCAFYRGETDEGVEQ